MPYYSLDGVRFYLPTYLLAALDDFHDIPETAVFHVTIPGIVEVLVKHSVFTPEQIRVIRLYLEYVRDDMPEAEFYRDDVVIALAELWPSETK